MPAAIVRGRFTRSGVHSNQEAILPNTEVITPFENRSGSRSLFRAVRHAGAAHDEPQVADVAAIYNQAGNRYAAYADGDPARLFAFDGLHAYADRAVWAQLDARLVALRAAGRTTIRILDAGCGPGTWLRRLVTRAHALGFTEIAARGFDIALAQIARARLRSRALSALPGIQLDFAVADLTQPLPEADRSVDLTLCLYSVLSHLPVESLPKVCAEFARVTAGHCVTTVRPVGSPPSVFVDSIAKARHFQQDNAHDCCEVELNDGRRFTMKLHLFAAPELRGYFARHFEIETMRGLDLFHSRFTPDPRWNPASAIDQDGPFDDALCGIEEACAANPRLIEHAAHMLLIARARSHAGDGA